MGTRIAVVALVALTALAGCRSTTATETPKVQVGSERMPPLEAASVGTGPACIAPVDTLEVAQRKADKDPVAVTEDPRSLVASWIPSMNATPAACVTLRTTSGRDVARRIAHEIDTAPAVKPGAYSCPNDDGAAVDLYFQLASGRWEAVRVDLSGCTWVHAPGFRSREFFPPLRTDVAKLAPPAYHDVIDWLTR